MSKYAIVNVATGNRYIRGQRRLHKALDQFGFDGVRMFYTDRMPEGCPAHSAVPYAFKPYAMAQAIKLGVDAVMWMDASVIPIRPLDALWKEIEENGYWFPNNGWNTGQWTSDAALPALGITREEAFEIPHMAATVMGLHMKSPIACTFFDEWFRLARLKHGTAFCGAWTNERGQVSADKRVLGHRHDQTAASVVAWKLGMTFVPQPKHFAYAIYDDQNWEHEPASEETVLLAAGRF